MAKDPFETRSPYETLAQSRCEYLIVAVGQSVALFAVPVILVYSLMLLDEFSWQIMLTLIVVLLMIPVGLLTPRLARRGHSRRASYLMLGAFMVMLAVNATMIEGLILLIAPCFIVIIVIAGMLVGPKGSYIVAVGASALWTVTLVVIERGWAPQASLPEPLGGVSMKIIMVLLFVFVAVLSWFATRDLQRALDDATYDLVQANRQLAEANKLKSQFTARTSHELRTPLSAIIVFTDLMLRKAYGPLTPKQENSLQRIYTSTKRLQALIEDILDLSKIEAGELEIVEEVVEVNRLTDMLLTTLEPSAQQKQLAFSVTLSDAMPQRIVGDEKRLSQILINLTDNAIKFTDRGEVRVLIEPTAGTQWRMAVQDTGRGIHEKDFQTIFDEFRQANGVATDPTTKGTGLGLAITRHLVRLMGGEIRLSSEIGKGSTFTVMLPLKLPEAHPAQRMPM